MKISIIMLTYNRRDINKKNIEYIEHNYIGNELVVVDNNSTDGTQKYLRKKENIHKIIYLDKNYGIPYARNIGANYSTGEILIFIDNDIFIEFDLRYLIYLFEKKNDLAAVSGKILDLNGNIETWVYKIDKNKYSDKKFFSYVFPGGATAIRKSFFFQVGGFDKDLFFTEEERDLSFRFINNNYKILYDPMLKFIHHHISECKIVNKDRFRRNYINKLFVYYKNVPLCFFVLSFIKIFIKCIYVSIKKYKNIIIPFLVLKKFIIECRKKDRAPIKSSSFIKYHKLKNLYIGCDK